jgi:hypothetical protein
VWSWLHLAIEAAALWADPVPNARPSLLHKSLTHNLAFHVEGSTIPTLATVVDAHEALILAVVFDRDVVVWCGHGLFLREPLCAFVDDVGENAFPLGRIEAVKGLVDRCPQLKQSAGALALAVELAVTAGARRQMAHFLDG